jgi:sigma-E factor negative regulatory protein RseC
VSATETPARVVRLEGDDAWVISEAPASCGACGGKGCGSSVFARLWRPDEPMYRVANPIGAAPGEEVVVGLPEGVLLRAALLAYGLPLGLILAGAILGQFLHGEPGALGGGLCGLLLATVFLRLSRGDAAPVILRRGTTACAAK